MNLVQNEEYEAIQPGHSGCPGCGLAMGMRMVLSALGHRAIVVIVPGCAAVITGPFPIYSMKVPVFHSAFEIAAPTGAGIANALKMQGKDDIPVLVFAGDGGTFDIGLQSLSGAADRNENFIYVCLDNEAYMNTGIQVSSSTPKHTWTGTTPLGKKSGRKKKIMDIMAAHGIPYAATASIGYPEDLTRKIKKAATIEGTRFLHLLVPCNTGWKIGDDMSPKVAQLSVETNIFPLYEIEDGIHVTLNHESKGLPVEKYLNLQGRYKHLSSEQIDDIQAETDRNWESLQRKIF